MLFRSTQGDTYTEQGATWTDNKDGTGDATVSGSVDTSAVGTYTISYDYTDTAGNAATTVTRTVSVIPTTTGTAIGTGSGYISPRLIIKKTAELLVRKLSRLIVKFPPPPPPT